MDEEEDIDRGDLIEDEDLNEESDIDDISGEEAEEDTSEEDLEIDEDEDSSEEVLEDEIQIPKSRLDEVIAQRESEKERTRWLEDQLEALINKSNTPAQEEAPDTPVFDFNKAEEEYANLLIEGETGKAANSRAAIDEARKAEMMTLINSIKESSVEEATSKSQETLENDKFDALINNFENKHAFLNADSGSYNEEAVETVNTLLAGYMSSGKTKTQALSLAVKKVAPMYSEEKPSIGNRQAKARKKAAKASNSQPPKGSSLSLDNKDAESIDISKLSEKAYSQLTLKEKRILRGD